MLKFRGHDVPNREATPYDPTHNQNVAGTSTPRQHQPEAGPSTKKVQKQKPSLAKVWDKKRKLRSRSILETKEQFRMNKKRADVRRKAQISPTVAEKIQLLNFVYVGNVRPDTTEEQLNIIFSQVGQVTRVLLRCAFGRIENPQPDDDSLYYATVEYVDHFVAHRALKLNGTRLNNRILTVTQDMSFIPELQHILELYQKRKEQELQPQP
ncbi:hypothetical protein C8Q75DRAFT_267643 [Abortiporus biennis]|nr:hypothetical protein C8Q75DRAFT_267643 [Abortiporus biennis]